MSTQTLERRPDAGTDFAELQTRMVAVAAAARAGCDGRSVVVVPSRTIDKWHEPAAETQAYEERMLCSLLELRDPALRMTYVTSSAVAPEIVDYYLGLLPRRLRAGARSRLTLIAAGDRRKLPLSRKLLDRPRLLARIRRTIPAPELCHLVPYTTTVLERDLAVALGIPMYGADPRHAGLGTKSGCRALFAEVGIPHPRGVEDITGAAHAVDAIARLRAADPGLAELVIKLNDGVSGEGNATIDVRCLPAPGAPSEARRIAERVAGLTLEAGGVTVEDYLLKLAAQGGIIEERIVGRDLRSPSVQIQVTPAGEVELLSTHDQILGGPRGQSYLGCRFPSDAAYAPAISGLGRKIGRRLAEIGVIGRFAIDFVIARDDDGGWRPYAIEINLRKGGTTHPYQTLTHLTGGAYRAASGTFTSPSGQRKHYVATDHLEAPELRTLGRAGVLALAARRDLRFNRLRRTGVVFHMLSSLDELGRTGFTAIENSPEEAEALYRRVTATLLEAADAAAAHAIRARPAALRRPIEVAPAA